jgi:hypothetical protein
VKSVKPSPFPIRPAEPLSGHHPTCSWSCPSPILPGGLLSVHLLRPPAAGGVPGKEKFAESVYPPLLAEMSAPAAPQTNNCLSWERCGKEMS